MNALSRETMNNLQFTPLIARTYGTAFLSALGRVASERSIDLHKYHVEGAALTALLGGIRTLPFQLEEFQKDLAMLSDAADSHKGGGQHQLHQQVFKAFEQNVDARRNAISKAACARLVGAEVGEYYALEALSCGYRFLQGNGPSTGGPIRDGFELLALAFEASGIK